MADQNNQLFCSIRLMHLMPVVVVAVRSSDEDGPVYTGWVATVVSLSDELKDIAVRRTDRRADEDQNEKSWTDLRCFHVDSRYRVARLHLRVALLYVNKGVTVTCKRIYFVYVKVLYLYASSTQTALLFICAIFVLLLQICAEIRLKIAEFGNFVFRRFLQLINSDFYISERVVNITKTKVNRTILISINRIGVCNST